MSQVKMPTYTKIYKFHVVISGSGYNIKLEKSLEYTNVDTIEEIVTNGELLEPNLNTSNCKGSLRG
jgi:hypothetical protein